MHTTFLNLVVTFGRNELPQFAFISIIYQSLLRIHFAVNKHFRLLRQLFRYLLLSSTQHKRVYLSAEFCSPLIISKLVNWYSICIFEKLLASQQSRTSKRKLSIKVKGIVLYRSARQHYPIPRL